MKKFLILPLLVLMFGSCVSSGKGLIGRGNTTTQKNVFNKTVSRSPKSNGLLGKIKNNPPKPEPSHASH